jgi:hypothetical protein
MKGTHRGRQASDPGAAARAEAEPMERSAASQLATVTRRSLQPPSCPPSERRRAVPIATSFSLVFRAYSRPMHSLCISVDSLLSAREYTAPLHSTGWHPNTSLLRARWTPAHILGPSHTQYGRFIPGAAFARYMWCDFDVPRLHAARRAP